MPKLMSVLLAVALAVAVAGCGSSGSEGSPTTAAKGTTTTTTAAGDEEPSADVSGITAEQYTESFVANLSSGDAEGSDLVLTKDQAECVAPKFVAAITVAKLHDAGATPEAVSDPGFQLAELGLDEDQGSALVASFEPCGVDIVDLFAKAMTQGLTEEQQACAAANLDEKLALTYLAEAFGGGQADLGPIQESLIAACGLPS